MAVAQAYAAKFSFRSRAGHGGTREKVYSDQLYEFLYEREYEAWFCNLARRNRAIRHLKDWFLKIHTGESLASATPDWPWDKRQKLGQQYLKNLAGDFLAWFESPETDQWYKNQHKDSYDNVKRQIELEGYLLREGELLQVEPDVLDMDAEKGLLGSLYDSSGLDRKSDALEFLTLSERHFVNGDWSDCISNARKFLELTLQQGAISLFAARGDKISERALTRPVEIRSILENEGLVEKQEREGLDKIYGLLSHTGSHPYMAEEDQARLLRQLSMTISQFVLLRLEGALKR